MNVYFTAPPGVDHEPVHLLHITAYKVQMPGKNVEAALKQHDIRARFLNKSGGLVGDTYIDPMYNAVAKTFRLAKRGAQEEITNILYTVNCVSGAVAKCICIVEVPGRVHVVWEYAGTSLTTSPHAMAFLKGRAGLEALVEFVGTAVADLRANSLIHIDWSPRNILYNADTGTLTLIDFGDMIHSHEDEFDGITLRTPMCKLVEHALRQLAQSITALHPLIRSA